ncbi:MAG: hypothetical protein RI542_08130 [Wenzhouxiangella sp.]|nr:hypothetical protein [Wenzhouxiangella sp.]
MPSKLEELTQGPISCNGPYSEEIEIRGQGWIYADHPRTPEGWPTGYVGYLIHQATPVPETNLTSLLLTVVENGGGNADLNSIWHLHHNPMNNTIEPQYSIIGGDRCNAGGMRIHQIKGEVLYYEHAVSPYRLLNIDNVGPPEITQVNQLTRFREGRAWPKNRSRNFLGWPFLRTVSDCYACCAGVVVKKHDLNTHRSTVDRVLINSELTIDDFFERPQLIACAHDWFASIKDMSKQDPSPNGENRIAFTASEWNEKRNELTLACQHVAL